nr:serine hydrolase [Bacteroidales bacterium]
MKKILFFLAAVALVAACGSPAATPTGGLKHVSPESMGMNSEKLNQIDREVAVAIEEGNIPGCVVSVVRDDKIVFLKAYGNKQVVPDTIPMTPETIFDLASVSKCVGTTL